MSTCWHTSRSPWMTSIGTSRSRHCCSNRSRPGSVELLAPPRWRRGSPGRLQRPRHGVLVLLGRVRLDELGAEEELDPAAVVGRDHVAVEQLPPGRVVEDLVPRRRCGHPVRLRRAEVRHAGCDGDQRGDALGVGGGELDRPPVGVAVGDDDCLARSRWRRARRRCRRRWPPGVVAATAVGRPERPLPRPSNVTTR